MRRQIVSTLVAVFVVDETLPMGLLVALVNASSSDDELFLGQFCGGVLT